MNFAILTVQALAFLSAFLSRSITLAVILAALRFFARAAAQRNERLNTLESSGMPKIGQLLGSVYLQLAAVLVAAARADTLIIA